VVSGRDGMDELSTAAVSDAMQVDGTTVSALTVDPAALGLAPPADGALAGGDPAHNAEVLRGVLAGAGGPAHDVVVLNAGAALWLAGRADSLAAALAPAEESIRSGAARERLDAFVAATRRLAGANGG
jgi:anthranilate phosphoribosyltransferase